MASRILVVLAVCCAVLMPAFTVVDCKAADSPLSVLTEKTIAFFQPVNLKVESVKANNIAIKAAGAHGLVEGMRLDIFREGETFYHPVTNEPLGKFEKPIGTAEVKGIEKGIAHAVMLTGTAKAGDLARITRSRIKALFFQDKSVDWYLGDAYFRDLKATRRFELIDTAIQSGNLPELFTQAKKEGAPLLVFIEAKAQGGQTTLIQKLYWVDDGKEIFTAKVAVPEEFVKEMRTASSFFLASSSEPVLTFKLPYGSNLIAIGDLEGNGKAEIIVDSGKSVKIFEPSVDMRLMWELKDSSIYEAIYLDTIDLNKNGKDEIVVVSIGKDEKNVESFIFELDGREFKKLWSVSGFLRAYEGRLLYQEFNSVLGYEGPVKEVVHANNAYSLGTVLDLPQNVSLYDFVVIGAPEKQRFLLAYDKHDYLNLYNNENFLVWRTSSSLGGLTKEYDREAPTVMVDRGKWFVPDKLSSYNNNYLAVRRVPFAGVVSTLGYKSSKLLSLRFNGLAMEEEVLIDDINGGVLDYAVHKDKVYLLSRPTMGLSLKNILKGENPRITWLFVFSLKAM